MTKLLDIRHTLEQRKGQRQRIERDIATATQRLKELRRSLRRHEQAREIVREVGLRTQQQLQYHISDIASLALEAVFEDPYTLTVEFVERRNKTECDLRFERNGKSITPKDASGGGAVDIAAFALRVASWSMAKPRTRPIIILDEPFRMLDVGRQQRAAPMIKEVSERLGIQFLIITHESMITSYADRVFETKIQKGVTTIT